MQDLIALAMELNAEDYLVWVEFDGQEKELEVETYRIDDTSGRWVKFDFSADDYQAACDWLRKDHDEFRKGRS